MLITNVGSFGQAVAEKKIKMWKLNGQDDGCQVMAKAHMAFKPDQVKKKIHQPIYNAFTIAYSIRLAKVISIQRWMTVLALDSFLH